MFLLVMFLQGGAGAGFSFELFALLRICY